MVRENHPILNSIANLVRIIIDGSRWGRILLVNEMRKTVLYIIQPVPDNHPCFYEQYSLPPKTSLTREAAVLGSKRNLTFIGSISFNKGICVQFDLSGIKRSIHFNRSFPCDRGDYWILIIILTKLGHSFNQCR